MSTLRALRGMGMRLVEPAMPTIQPDSVPITAQTAMHECCICLEHPARYRWSHCAHPEPLICLRCKNQLFGTMGSRRPCPCIICRRPGNFILHKLAR